MTYNVFSGMLNPTQSINQSTWYWQCLGPASTVIRSWTECPYTL